MKKLTYFSLFVFSAMFICFAVLVTASANAQTYLPFRGGSNFSWFDSTQYSGKENFGVIQRYDEAEPGGAQEQINARLTAMRATPENQQTIRLNVYHRRKPAGYLDTDYTDYQDTKTGNSLFLRGDRALHPQTKANFIALITKMRDLGFRRVIIAFMPLGDSVPWPKQGGRWWGPCPDETTWLADPMRQTIWEENANFIGDVTNEVWAQHPVPGIEVWIDLGNELAPPNPAPDLSGLKGGDQGFLAYYVEKMYQDFAHTWCGTTGATRYWPGTTDPIGSLVGFSALSPDGVRNMYLLSSGRPPGAFSVSIYGNNGSCRGGPGSAYEYLYETGRRLIDLGLPGYNLIIGECYYNSSADAQDFTNALNALGSGKPTVLGLTQFPVSRPVAEGGNCISTSYYMPVPVPKADPRGRRLCRNGQRGQPGTSRSWCNVKIVMVLVQRLIPLMAATPEFTAYGDLNF